VILPLARSFDVTQSLQRLDQRAEKNGSMAP
jgi:hypothetical protein